VSPVTGVIHQDHQCNGGPAEDVEGKVALIQSKAV
jgi:hypothetical protein